jgi:branched-chain amino acid transport system ATP-binding protein
MALVLGLGLFGLRPFGLGSGYVSAVIVMAGIYIILAMGLNIVVGYAGLLDLGYAGFWAVGAYTSALLTSTATFHPVRLSVWAAMPLAVLVTVASGVLLGLVTLRVRGDYLAIVTLGYGEIVRIVVNSWDSVTNGPNGVTDIPHPALFGYNFGLDARPYVALTWTCIGLLYWLVSNLWRSWVGRAWYATRQDEDAAEFIGVPTFRMKLLAFALGASTAGFAGVLYSSFVGYIAPSNFTLTTAVMILAAVVLGGMSNSRGVMVGAAIIVLLPELFRDFEQARYLVFGAVLVLMMVVRPAGLFPLRPRRYRVTSRRNSTQGTDERSAGAADSAIILECASVTKRFGGLTAVNNVSFAVREGSIFAVIGPNGAGKSTLFDLLSGAASCDGGEVRLFGSPIAGLRPHAVAARGIARTFQLIRLFPAVSVVENVLVGADLHNDSTVLGIVVGTRGAHRAETAALDVVSDVLDFCGVEHLAGLLAGGLSYGDQRRVEIARALASSPRLLLLDEPAAGMNPTERQGLMALIRKIAAIGVTILIIEHDVGLVMGISDEVLVLDHGVIIAHGRPDVVQGEPAVVEAYLGVGSVAVAAKLAAADTRQQGGIPALEVSDLKVRYGPIEAVHGIDLTVNAGEIVSIIGANGAGKTSSLLAISGVHRAAAGTVVFRGARIESWPAHTVAAAGIAHVPEGRRIFPRMTVWENLAMGTYANHRLPSSEDLDYVFSLFPILKDRLGQIGGTLSGGEQQMLAMGRALVARPSLMMLDEPSMGLAPQMVARVFDLIREINRAGIAILLVEQNARMALSASQRGYVLETGRVRLSGTAAELLDNAAVQAAYLGG